VALTPAQIRQQVDDALTAAWAAIQSREDSYATAHSGRYWQGLLSHTAIPADGATATPDVGIRTPTDQPTVWPVGIRSTALPCAIQIDCYDGPQGPGYQATVYVLISGNVWSRTAQVGPETYRVHGWSQVS
jgi:hypothetical protein